MNKVTLSIFAFCISSTFGIAQNSKSPEVTICKSTSSTFSVAELEKCHMVVPADEKLKVKSFLLNYLVAGSNGDVFIDIPVQGNNFSPKALATLKEKAGSIKKIVVEQVVVVDATHTEKKISGMEILIQK
ncbi:MAG: hypothetical protein K0Q95_2461 [Bacteroidota bacterium]|jgi:hypothetical protein|nr:hypothetical protein [Bacteroidota bacterium]